MLTLVRDQQKLRVASDFLSFLLSPHPTLVISLPPPLDKPFLLQLVEWLLRGVSRVILANNPLSGVLILAALAWSSPWSALLGTTGLLAGTLTAVLKGQDRCGGGGMHTYTWTHTHDSECAWF